VCDWIWQRAPADAVGSARAAQQPSHRVSNESVFGALLGIAKHRGGGHNVAPSPAAIFTSAHPVLAVGLTRLGARMQKFKKDVIQPD
jgi:hypothetical protein